MAQDKGRFLHPFDYVGHGERLSRARHAQQRLVGSAVEHAPAQFVDGFRLVAGGTIGRNKFEIHDIRFVKIRE